MYLIVAHGTSKLKRLEHHLNGGHERYIRMYNSRMCSLDKSSGSPFMPRTATSTKPRKTPAETRDDLDLTLMERFIERSDIKLDVAACIRSFLFGLTVLIITINSVWNAKPTQVQPAFTERFLISAGEATKRAIR